MTTFQATEFAYEIEDGWRDQTRYLYDHGSVRATIEVYSSVQNYPREIEKTMERFRLAVPSYALLERRKLDRPAPGAELFAHRLGGDFTSFEITVFWPVGELMWMFRATGPHAEEDRCREMVETFLDTYQPVDL